jgi:hypothetical protein
MSEMKAHSALGTAWRCGGWQLMAALLSMLAVQAPAAADPPSSFGLPPPQTPVFCLTSEHVYQPLVRTNFARLWNDYLRKLNLIGRIRGSRLIFRGGRRNAETITYSIEPHAGGIALLDMHVRLHHLSEDHSGTQMCMYTFILINRP